MTTENKKEPVKVKKTPAAKKPATKKPVAKKQVAKKPVTKKQTVKKDLVEKVSKAHIEFSKDKLEKEFVLDTENLDITVKKDDEKVTVTVDANGGLLKKFFALALKLFRKK